MFRKASTVFVLSLLHGTALAQSASPAAPPPPPAAPMEEMVVTAQKRSQSLQQVPMAVSAIGGQTLQRAVVQDIVDLQRTVPSLNVVTLNRPSTSTAFRLRGVGTTGSDSGLEGAVGFFVDGVYRSRSGTGLGDFVDVERVEVLRGPQGTLFGKNTSAGAISIVTRRPTFDLEGFGEVVLGDYDSRKISGAVNVPVVDQTLALRISGNYNERIGFIRDTVTGDRFNDRDRWSVSGKLLFTPTPDLEFLFTVDYADANESCCQAVRLSNAPNSPIVPLLAGLAAASGSSYPVNPTPTRFETAVNGPSVADFEDIGYSLQGEWDVGIGTITSISSYRTFDSLAENDVDYSGADLVYQNLGFDSEIFSQELRIQGRYDGFLSGLDWLVGLYYADEEIGYFETPDIRRDLRPYFSALLRNPALGALYPEMVDAFGNFSNQDGQTFAAFTHNILDITEKLSLTAGMRFTTDDKEAVSETFWNHPAGQLPFTALGLPFAAHNSYVADFSDSDVTWTINLSYRWTNDLMTYGSIGHGYKSGGLVLAREAAGLQFSTNPLCSASRLVAIPAGGGLPTIFDCDVQDPSFDSETVDAYEIGLRSSLFSKSLVFNLTGFWADYDDLQLNTFNGFSFTIQNAGTARTRGVELETQYATPLEGLVLGANVSFTDARFGEEVGVIQSGEPAVGGDPLDNAPRWTGALTLDYASPILGDDNVFVRAEYFFNSSQKTLTRVDSVGRPLSISSYDLLNFAIGYEWRYGLEFSAYCRNCVDERYVTAIFNSVAQSGSKDQFLGNPLEYGFRLRKSF